MQNIKCYEKKHRVLWELYTAKELLYWIRPSAHLAQDLVFLVKPHVLSTKVGAGLILTLHFINWKIEGIL